MSTAFKTFILPQLLLLNTPHWFNILIFFTQDEPTSNVPNSILYFPRTYYAMHSKITSFVRGSYPCHKHWICQIRKLFQILNMYNCSLEYITPSAAGVGTNSTVKHLSAFYTNYFPGRSPTQAARKTPQPTKTIHTRQNQCQDYEHLQLLKGFCIPLSLQAPSCVLHGHHPTIHHTPLSIPIPILIATHPWRPWPTRIPKGPFTRCQLRCPVTGCQVLSPCKHIGQ
jgi:hypothetical protein